MLNKQQLIIKFFFFITFVFAQIADAQSLKKIFFIAVGYNIQMDTLPPDNFWRRLKQACADHGYDLTMREPSEAVYAIVCFNAPGFDVRYYPARYRILYTWEPPTIIPHNFDSFVQAHYDYIVTWHDDLIDGNRYQKLYNCIHLEVAKELMPFKQKKFCTMLVGNKCSSHPDELYSKRHEMIQFFEQNPSIDFDFYGPDWPHSYRNYGGFVDDKIATLKRYKFCICYENMKNIPGYITEKIFDCFMAGTVPVYWGASNITDFIPKNCFIDRRDFADNKALIEYLTTITQEQYSAYISCGKTFLQSSAAYLFSDECFIKRFIQLLDGLEKENFKF